MRAVHVACDAELLMLAANMLNRQHYSCMSASVFARLCLDRGDGHGVNDVFGFAAARKIVGGFVESLENRSDGGRAGQSFGKFVGDVARLQVRERSTRLLGRPPASQELLTAQPRDQRGIRLQFAIDLKLRRSGFCRSAWPRPLYRPADVWRCLWSKTKAWRRAASCPAMRDMNPPKQSQSPPTPRQTVR